MTIARWAGLTYLFLIATGMFAIAYAPGQYMVSGDAEATFAKIVEAQILYKAAIVAEMACYASFVLLAVLFHRLFHNWSETLALLLVAFVLASVPISFVAIGEKLAVLDLLAQGPSQAAAVSALLDRYANIRDTAEVFWGLWLAPYGLLVLKSRAIPRFFGIALILGCLSYVAGATVPLFWVGYHDNPIGQYADIPGTIGEIGGALWWTIMGARSSDNLVSG